MKRRLALLGISAAAALAVFTTGVVFASGGTSCPDIDSTDCVVTDMTVQSNCCVDTGNGSYHSATCSRDSFMCILRNGDINDALGGAYNCQNPGPTCGN